MLNAFILAFILMIEALYILDIVAILIVELAVPQHDAFLNLILLDTSGALLCELVNEMPVEPILTKIHRIIRSVDKVEMLPQILSRTKP